MSDRSPKGRLPQKQPRISVIIPVYNREHLIACAIDSVVNQTETDWELIIVDDGSEDATGRICDQYAEADPRLHVLHTKNRGVSAARNAGLQEACGEWVIFLDSDDVYEPDAFRMMLEQSAGMDLVAASMRYAESAEARLLATEKRVYLDWFATLEQGFHTLYAGFFYSSVCAKLYRRAALTAAFDPALSYAEDILFNLKVMPGMQRICVLPDVCYAFTYRLGESHGQRAELMQLEVQKQVIGCWKDVLYPKYAQQLSHVFRRYTEFVLKFIIKLLRAERLPLVYRTAILAAQLDSMLVDEQLYGYDCLPDGHRAFWQMLRMRDVDAIVHALPTLEAQCFDKPLEVYQKNADGSLQEIGKTGAAD